MKKSIIILVAAVVLLMGSSCRKVVGRGPVQSEIRDITNFSGVSSEIAGTINYTIAPEYKVELFAQRNVLNVLETFVTNGHLHIKGKNGVFIKDDEDIVINVSAPTAAYLQQSGTGTLTVNGDLVTQNLDMGVSGSGNIFVEKTAIDNKIDADVSGSGYIEIKNGTAYEENFKVSGRGKIRMDSVYAENAKVNVSGSGDVYLNLSQALNGDVSGSGSVFYLGNPELNVHVSGSGKVNRLK